MIINAYTILVMLSVLVVLSYVFNYVSAAVKVPSVLLLIGSGIALKYLADWFGLVLPPTKTLLELLGITGLIFIVLEAALDLSIERRKLPLIGRAFGSALILLAATSGLIAFVFMYYYNISFRQGMLHAVPLSVISSSIAIPSVKNMDEHKREFVVYESTFSDIIGIVLFNVLVSEQAAGIGAILNFSWDIFLILLVSVVSTIALIFLLNRTTSNVRFFLTFAMLILAYSLAKFLHLPSLILVLCFGLVVNNFNLFDYPIVRRFLSFEKLSDVAKEMKVMTSETAFIIRTFFFLLFGYSINLVLLESLEVIITGVVIIFITLALRFVFLRYILKISSAPLTLIAPRGLITILLFYSIPVEQRVEQLSEGVLFIVIAFTGLMMTLGLLLNKQNPKENIEDVI